ncbi:MAG TPA: isochorismatase family cysteine hydrolase [Sphaerochaeta sp.]|nr:isochorismatase family cysteine hydrolase [Sphaerochaeta sp.]HQB89794.1 isochorismatase family cysteine hydrolase [Sphaerochaeta sp.]
MNSDSRDKKRLLVVVDMQEDFVRGSLATKEAQAIICAVQEKIKGHNGPLAYTLDTHDEGYLATSEGAHLPVVHCVKGEAGHRLIGELTDLLADGECFEKPTFGSVALAERIRDDETIDEVELVGVCTDICVVSNALLIKAMRPELTVLVDPTCCAGSSVERHLASLETMKSCQIEGI